MTVGTVANTQSFLTDTVKAALTSPLKASSPVVFRSGFSYFTVTGVSVGQDEAGNPAIEITGQ